MLFAVAIVSTRRTESEVIHAYTRTHTPCIYMRRFALPVSFAVSLSVALASCLPLAKGNKLNPVEAVDARGCAEGGCHHHHHIHLHLHRQQHYHHQQSTNSSSSSGTTNTGTSLALPVFVCGAACADCLAANAKGGGRAWLHENAMCLK